MLVLFDKRILKGITHTVKDKIWKPLEFYSSCSVAEQSLFFFGWQFQPEYGGSVACLVQGGRKMTGEFK